MTSTEKSLLEAALRLPAKTRATIAKKLVQSLEADKLEADKNGKKVELSEGILAAIEEAEEHWLAYQRGEIRGYSVDEVFLSLRKKRRKS